MGAKIVAFPIESASEGIAGKGFLLERESSRLVPPDDTGHGEWLAVVSLMPTQFAAHVDEYPGEHDAHDKVSYNHPQAICPQNGPNPQCQKRDE